MSTKLQKKIEQEANRIVNVADFGASPDADAATNTAAFQAAIDIQAAIEVPSGEYAVESLSGYTSSGKDEEAAMEPVAAAVPDSLHALDTSPVNSKIVVTDEGPILATPDFETLLPKGDLAHRLPVGAKILKRAEGIYWSIQMSPAIDHPVLVTATARDAIAQFVPHFHED